jgi:hypothetical protein
MSGATSVHADSVAAVKKSLQTLYHQSSQAFGHKDADGACAMYDPDCTIYTSTGDTAGLDSVRDLLGKILGVFQKVSETITVKSCSVASSDGTESAKIGLSDIRTEVIFSPQGKKYLVKDVMTRRDYWEKGDDGWKIKQSRILSDIPYINGKRAESVDPSDFDNQ